MPSVGCNRRVAGKLHAGGEPRGQRFARRDIPCASHAIATARDQHRTVRTEGHAVDKAPVSHWPSADGERPRISDSNLSAERPDRNISIVGTEPQHRWPAAEKQLRCRDRLASSMTPHSNSLIVADAPHLAASLVDRWRTQSGTDIAWLARATIRPVTTSHNVRFPVLGVAAVKSATTIGGELETHDLAVGMLEDMKCIRPVAASHTLRFTWPGGVGTSG